MDEYVKVIFDEDDRIVVVDGRPGGRTNRVFIVPTGFHTFSLDDVPDCEPPSCTELIRRTRDDRPFEITFTRRQSAVAANAGAADA